MTRSARRYSATFSDGETISRGSNRVVTHAWRFRARRFDTFDCTGGAGFSASASRAERTAMSQAAYTRRHPEKFEFLGVEIVAVVEEE